MYFDVVEPVFLYLQHVPLMCTEGRNNYQSLEVVSLYRDSQPQVMQITHICLICDQTFTNLDV